MFWKIILYHFQYKQDRYFFKLCFRPTECHQVDVNKLMLLLRMGSYATTRQQNHKDNFLQFLKIHPQKFLRHIIYSWQYGILQMPKFTKYCVFKLNLKHRIAHTVTVYVFVVQMPVGCVTYAEL